MDKCVSLISHLLSYFTYAHTHIHVHTYLHNHEDVVLGRVIDNLKEQDHIAVIEVTHHFDLIVDLYTCVCVCMCMCVCVWEQGARMR